MDNSSTNHNQNADQQRNEDEKKLENYCRQACCLLDEIGATNFLYQIRRIKDYATEIFKDFRYDIEKSYSMINDNDPGDDGDKSKIKTSGDEYDPGEMITDTGEVIDELTPDGDNDDKNNDGGRTDDKNVDNVEYDFLKDLQENFEKNLKITKSNTIINDKMPFAILLMLHRMAKTLKEGIEKRKFIIYQSNHFINIFSSFFVPKQVLQEKDLNIDTLPKNLLNIQMKIMLFEDQYNQQIINLKSKINEKLMKKFRFIRSFFQIFRKELLLFLDFLTTIRSKTFPQPGPFYERHLLFKYWRGEYLGKNFRQYQSFTRMFINRMHTFLYLIEEELIDGHHTKNLEQAVRLFISNDDDYSINDDLLYQIPIIDEIFHYANTLLKFESDRANLILNNDNYFNNYGNNDHDHNHDANNNYPFLFSDLTITTDNLATCGFSFFDPKSDNDDDNNDNNVSTSVANPKNLDNNVQSSFADPKIATNAADICREYIFSDSENDDAPVSFSDLKNDSLFSFTNFKNVKK